MTSHCKSTASPMWPGNSANASENVPGVLQSCISACLAGKFLSSKVKYRVCFGSILPTLPATLTLEVASSVDSHEFAVPCSRLAAEFRAKPSWGPCQRRASANLPHRDIKAWLPRREPSKGVYLSTSGDFITNAPCRNVYSTTVLKTLFIRHQ